MSSPTTHPPSVPPPDSGPGFDFVTWFELNRRSILIVIGIVCAAIAGLTVVRAQQRSRQAQATKELLLLTPPTGPGEAASVADPDKLLALSRQFAGTTGGEQAFLLGAGQLFAKGTYAEAQSAFSGFEEKYPESPFLGVAMLGVAASLEAQGKTAEALSAYDRTIVTSGGESFVAQARLAKARLLTATQPAQALALYDEVLKGSAAATFGEQASMNRAQILLQHPELVAAMTTNSVVVKPAGATNLVPAALP